MTSLLNIKHSETPPENRLAFVEYRGLSLYTADNDIRPKETFLLLQMFIDFEAGGQKSLTPILTILVGKQLTPPKPCDVSWGPYQAKMPSNSI